MFVSAVTPVILILHCHPICQGPPGGGGPPGTPIMPSPGGASPNYVPGTNTCVTSRKMSLSHLSLLNKHDQTLLTNQTFFFFYFKTVFIFFTFIILFLVFTSVSIEAE